MPDFIVCDPIQDGQPVSLLADYIFADVGFHALYPPARHLSAKIRTFVDTLAEHF
tara:strand:+ start:474 stop:638 length:165 start_codon:yes stop_codon:yes gene_type:complete